MANEWGTQKQDMQIAHDIVNKHLDCNDGEPLGLLEVVVNHRKTEKIQIKVSDWVLEIAERFGQTYGYEQGHQVASKVITKLLLIREVIH